MSVKKYVIAFVVILVLTNIGNFLIHGMLLHDAYSHYPNILRTEQDSQAHMSGLMAGFLFFTIGFVWLYGQWKQTGNWIADGAKFSIAVWLVASVSRYAIYYAIQPWSMDVVWMQIGYELVMTLILGIAVGFVMKEQ